MPGRSNLQRLLVGLTVAHLVAFAGWVWMRSTGISGVLYADGTPVGGDFINLWSAAGLTLAGLHDDIYVVAEFQRFQAGVTGGADIGLRLWAYPPHSLLFAWPFGLLGFYPAMAAWSCLGLATLTLGALRFGFDRIETAILVGSPASLLCIYYGQSGLVATGLLLLALSARGRLDLVAIAATVVLTIKPQAGVLIPVVWAVQRRWAMIVLTGSGILALLALSLALHGADPWRDYVGDTLPVLSALERHGSGPFMTMIPSAFMSVRLLGGDGDTALVVHGVFALGVLGFVVHRLWRERDAMRQAALVLIGTVLVTPYVHNYDLAILLAGALLVTRRAREDAMPPGGEAVVVSAWALPHLVVLMARIGAPLSPVFVLLLLLLA